MSGNPLAALLMRQIAAEGPLSVGRFMAEALQHPQHGYYTTRDPFGRAGDFTTAPEISQIFGELIGLWCAVTWQQLGRPQPIQLAELGPGRGTLMADALRACRQVPDFMAALRLRLIESSPILKEKQATALRDYRPQWYAGPEALPAGPMLLLANEFFDALPIRQYVRTADGWHERMVGIADERLQFVLGPGRLPDAAVPKVLRHLPPDSVIELSPAREGLMAALAERLVRDGGALLLIDYGHCPSAPGDTLQAVRGQAFHPVLEDPGEADLTAHVDFACLAAAAQQAGAAVYGPVPQGRFLRALGIEARAAALAAAQPGEAAGIRQALQRLTAEGAMGSLFKAMAVTAPGVPVPAGFESAETAQQ